MSLCLAWEEQEPDPSWNHGCPRWMRRNLAYCIRTPLMHTIAKFFSSNMYKCKSEQHRRKAASKRPRSYAVYVHRSPS
jgi:hypothetical protein